MGETVGRYRLVAELGRGGMANVYLAVTDAMGGAFSKLVVVKQLREHLASDPEFVTMFLDEARLAARLNHPNVVQTLDSGQVGSDLYIAMEYLDGQPLHRVVARAKDSLALSTHLSILSDTLSGLHYAHELADFDGSLLHVVHRDVTPHNVFVTYDGQVKVVDFGIARAEGRASQTRHGVIKGKIAYMAPEQARADVIDRRADVFAVGVMLYEALVGERMWGDRSEKAILRALVGGDIPASPRDRRPAVPESLDAICRRALAADASQRYATAAEMQQAIDEVLEQTWGRPSVRKLGSEVARLFADRRELTKRVIETQLAHLTAESRVSVVSMRTALGEGAPSASTEPRIPEPRLEEREPDPSAITARLDSKDTRVGAPDAELLALVRKPERDTVRPAKRDKPTAPIAPKADVLPSAEEREPPSTKPHTVRAQRARSGRAWMAWLGVVLASAGAALLARAVTTPAKAAAEGTDTVEIVLRATPESARFRIDDGPPLTNPYVGRLPRDQAAHTLTIEAPGHATKVQKLSLTSDVSLRFVLVAP